MATEGKSKRGERDEGSMIVFRDGSTSGLSVEQLSRGEWKHVREIQHGH